MHGCGGCKNSYVYCKASQPGTLFTPLHKSHDCDCCLCAALLQAMALSLRMAHVTYAPLGTLGRASNANHASPALLASPALQGRQEENVFHSPSPALWARLWTLKTILSQLPTATACLGLEVVQHLKTPARCACQGPTPLALAPSRASPAPSCSRVPSGP